MKFYVATVLSSRFGRCGENHIDRLTVSIPCESEEAANGAAMKFWQESYQKSNRFISFGAIDLTQAAIDFVRDNS